MRSNLRAGGCCNPFSCVCVRFRVLSFLLVWIVLSTWGGQPRQSILTYIYIYTCVYIYIYIYNWRLLICTSHLPRTQAQGVEPNHFFTNLCGHKPVAAASPGTGSFVCFCLSDIWPTVFADAARQWPRALYQERENPFQINQFGEYYWMCGPRMSLYDRLLALTKNWHRLGPNFWQILSVYSQLVGTFWFSSALGRLTKSVCWLLPDCDQLEKVALASVQGLVEADLGH